MLMNCEALRTKFKGTALESTCEMLGRFDLYHLLFKPVLESSLKAVKRFSFAPFEYRKWCGVCAGGDLQVCEFLGESGYDKDTGIRYGTYDEYEEESRKAGLPGEYFVFAVANFGDYYCFRNSSDGTEDGKVYQWGVHEGEVVLIWDCFSDWLSEQVNTWVEMIADDELEPIALKLEDNDE